MASKVGEKTLHKRIAIHVGGFVPGTNNAIAGITLAGFTLGWEVVCILDGFEGLLHPEKFPDGGLMALNQNIVRNLDISSVGNFRKLFRTDPFHLRKLNETNTNEEAGRAEIIVKKLKENNIDALISVAGEEDFSIFDKLNREGVDTVCIPASIENDIAATSNSLGFTTALSFTIDLLCRALQNARSACKIAVVEVPGQQAGWLALHSAIAVCADAVLIPEIPYDLKHLALGLKDKMYVKRPYGLVVVAEGARMAKNTLTEEENPLKISLSPLVSGYSNRSLAQRSGSAAEAIARELQLLIVEETFPMVIGPWVHCGNPTVIDRHLGIAFGAGAIQALVEGKTGTMVSCVPPEIRFVPLSEVITKVRTVPADSEYLKLALSLGINFGK